MWPYHTGIGSQNKIGLRPGQWVRKEGVCKPPSEYEQGDHAPLLVQEEIN